MRKEELTNQEFVVICRQNDITLEELMKMFKEKKKRRNQIMKDKLGKKKPIVSVIGIMLAVMMCFGGITF